MVTHPTFERSRRRGIAVIYLAVVLGTLIGVVGLAADTAYVFLSAHQLQNAADSAALSAAEEVGFDTSQAKTDAVNTAAANRAAGASVQLDINNDITIGNYKRTNSTFSANTTPYNAVQVIARRTSGSKGGAVNLFFAPIFGISSSNVSRQSIAMTSSLGEGLIVLDSTASPALQFIGSGSNKEKIKIPNGGVAIDSNSTTAFDWSGDSKGYINALSLNIVGNETTLVAGGTQFPTGALTLQAPLVADPLASLPVPAQGATQNGTSSPLPPGYYPNGLPAGTLSGGIYYVDGGISLAGNDTLTCTTGCLIYLHTGGISMTGNSNIDITPLSSGTYAGISFYEDRSNTSPITLRGTSGNSTTGVMYFPAAHVSIAGTPDSVASQLICDTLDIQGTGQLNINYNGQNSVARHQAFLVQ
jgi:Flp pilus assembly protein TadG